MGEPPDIPEGMLWCFVCKKIYKPRYALKEVAEETNDMEAREQWISGACSTECFNKALNIK